MWYCKKKKTTKLFFNKYVNRVSINTPFAASFRGKKLENVQNMVDQVFAIFVSKNMTGSVQIGSTWNRKYVSLDAVVGVSNLLKVLENYDDFTVRVEHNTLNIYCNDDSLIDSVSNIKELEVAEINTPQDQKARELLLNNPRSIIRADYTHKYKVTVSWLGQEQADSFVEWAKRLPKIKCASKKYCYGGHFYVADDKTLNLCRLFLSDKIRKVEQLIKAEEF